MGKLLRDLVVGGGSIVAQALPPIWVNSPSSRDSPSTTFVGIITIPTSIYGVEW